MRSGAAARSVVVGIAMVSGAGAGACGFFDEPHLVGAGAATDASTTGDAPAGDASGPTLGSVEPYRASVKGDGPIAYWALDETTGTTVHDAIGGHDGQLDPSGFTLASDGAFPTPNTSILFSGGDANFGSTSFGFEGTAPFSIELWIEPTQYTTTDQYIFAKEQRTGVHSGWALLFSDGAQLQFERQVSNDAGPPTAQCTAALLPLNVFSHVVGTYDGTTLRLYVNGVVVDTHPDARATTSNTRNAVLAGSTSAAGMIGRLDEVAIYDKALSPDRITAHLAAARP